MSDTECLEVVVREAVTSMASLSIGSGQAAQGGVCGVPVYANDVTDCGAVSFTISFDKTVATIETIEAHAGLSNASVVTNIVNDQGFAKVVFTKTDGISTNVAAPIVMVTFKAVGGYGSTTPLTLSDGTWANRTDFLPVDITDYIAGTITIYVRGDLNFNGVVDTGDVLAVAMMVVGSVPQNLQADFNNSGAVDAGDLLKIAMFFLGSIPSL